MNYKNYQNKIKIYNKKGILNNKLIQRIDIIITISS